MTAENIKLEPFKMENIPLIVDVVEPLWSPPIGTAEFKRFNVEFIVRNNIAENDYRFELIDDKNNELLASAFFARKGDECIVEKWFEKEAVRFQESFLSASNMSRTFLRMMDKRTLDLMNDDDIKLSLFISRKSGAGSMILNLLSKKLCAEGWKNLYLWTDCECNWKWYEAHGFELVLEDTYEPFSSEQEDYKVYIFKKALSS